MGNVDGLIGAVYVSIFGNLSLYNKLFIPADSKTAMPHLYISSLYELLFRWEGGVLSAWHVDNSSTPPFQSICMARV